MDAIDDLLAQLTTAEKVSLTAGVDMWRTPPVERLGIGAFKTTDGPVGARGEHHAGGPPSAAFPCGTALAATWDIELVEAVGRELGAETKAKGAHLLLAPTVNLHRHPLAGRNFECYSEDPHLTARMAVAVIGGIQSTGVGACIKHLVANDSEYERFTMSSEVPERALRELYLRPFQEAMGEVAPVAVMAAYNKLAGSWCSESPELLTTILRDEWGFDGLVVSDWWATHTTSEAIEAGLDLEMPGPTLYRGDKLEATLERDATDGTHRTAAALDRAVRNLLVAMERTGATTGPRPAERSDDTDGRRAVARSAAAGAIVLLRNEPVEGRPVLPLDPDRLQSLAVIGPNAERTTILGGGSAAVSPYREVSVLEGLRSRLEEVEIRHEPGDSILRFPAPLRLAATTTPGGEPGIAVAYVRGNDPVADDVVLEQVTRRAAFVWSGTSPGGEDGPWSARGACRFEPSVTGLHRFQLVLSGWARLGLDGEVVVDAWEGSEEGRRVEGTVELQAGQTVDLTFDYRAPTGETFAPDGGIGAGLEIRCLPPVADNGFERAVEVAAQCDVALVVVGTNDDWETEGRDRRDMSLPGRQAELIEAVVAANPRTVVLVNAGAPVDMSWAQRVPAVAQMWFLGQETGHAVADVLTGDVDASGRLPTTLPQGLEDTPAFDNYPGEHGQVHYGEGLFIGYRWYDARRIEPAFPFGHGLSYTSFEHGPVIVGAETVLRHEPAIGGRSVPQNGNRTVTARVTVTNTGSRPGTEVLQLYVGAAPDRPDDPLRQLRGFAKLELEPGASGDVCFELSAADFAVWSPDEHAWTVPPGDRHLAVGRSSAELTSQAVVPADAVPSTLP